MVVFYKRVQLIDESLNDPPVFDRDMFEGQGLDSLKMDPLPLSIVKRSPVLLIRVM